MSDTASVNERLARLTALGTSIWLDQIERKLVEGGELARLIEEESLRGMTSNPAIFEKAILGSEEYDDQISAVAHEGGDQRAIYQAIAIQDVSSAADVLRGVYDSTDGYDGYVSLEVDPDLAFDTDKTITQAQEYWERVDRPNLMIKIPGTDEGLPAITASIAAGINVNVTLLFKVGQYEKVMDAWMSGLERRVAAGEPIDRIHSVASFFVSRVDTEVDQRLEGTDHEDLQGTAGLANARAAYQAYLKAVKNSERFAKLAEKGASVQRPLWASTGVKNPKYPATLYVDGLAGPETVNTMPVATLEAAGEQSAVTEPTVTIDPTDQLEALADAGIDLDDVTDKLLKDGVDAFVTPMEKLLDALGTKAKAVA
ncbi:MAG TPA: transaldolase [Baekduia sp.]|uniref:transaldolase n=1 Tax=Baekduia sp. TaxID=2600305 RepID=UPI002D774C3B|nr:transaldolase [Baekduia sp.]HET6506600.1 transaldolase [Baekduia sp.]